MSRSSVHAGGAERFAGASDHHDTRTIRVWDRFVRLFHWTLVAAFFVAWCFTESIGLVHKTAGYVTVALVVARVVWGFIGSRHARFASFVPTPRRLVTYVGALAQGREPRHAGHNPLGALMILFLLGAVLTIGLSGWMMTLDAFWGNDLVETVHTQAVDVALLAMVVHVLANVMASVRHRENLILSMVTGRKPLATSQRPEDDLSAQQQA
jgi:cytochrome b